MEIYVQHVEIGFLRNCKNPVIEVEESNCQANTYQGDKELKELFDLVVSGQYILALNNKLVVDLLTSAIQEQCLSPEIIKNAKIHSSVSEDLLSHLGLLSIAISCLQLYTQYNWTGPQPDSGCLPTFISHLSKSSNELCVDGEEVYSQSHHIELLYIARTILLDCRESLQSFETAPWWLLRCLQTHQALLAERSSTLKATCMQLIDSLSSNEVIFGKDEYRDLAMQFHLEACHLGYFYYEPSLAKEHISTAHKLSGVQISLTGEMGRRTRYQQKDVPQLVIAIKPDGEQPWSHFSTSNKDFYPRDVALDDDTVYDQMKMTETDKTPTQLTAEQQAMVLGLCYHHRKSHEGQGKIVQEEIMAYMNCVLGRPCSWVVQCVALLTRTRFEWESARRLSRSITQYEELICQIKHPEPAGEHRLPLVYSVKLPPIWSIECELASLFEKTGSSTSALEVYLRLQMWEDVIRCYTKLGKIEKAETLIREQLAIRETPSLWCYLGDVKSCAEHYQHAWELSGGHYGRAQRSLGYLYMTQKQYEKSLSCFEKAVSINSLQIGVWFTYGCAALACEQFTTAAMAFRRCVNLDGDNFEAWNNLATAYIKSKQKPRAFTTLQEALKCDYENWKIWENYLLVATDIGEFVEAVRAYHRMLDLRKRHADSEVLNVLVRAVSEDIQDACGESAAQLRPKLLELMGRITAMVTDDGNIWRLYARLILSDKDVCQTSRERAVQCLQKSHRCSTQAVGWEQSRSTCLTVLQQTHQLASAYLECSKTAEPAYSVQMLSSAKLSLKGVLTKVKQRHTDPVSDQLPAELLEAHNMLQDALENILAHIQSATGV